MRHVSPMRERFQNSFYNDKIKVLEQLNYKKPQFPPDVFYIKSRPDLIKKYLDPKEYQKLIDEAEPKKRDYYKFF